jgi:RimK family alpha-L-glutamate ligase
MTSRFERPGVRRAVVAWQRTSTNVALARTADWLLLTPPEALRRLRAGDVALARLDVRRTLDGIEDGLEALGELSARGVTVLNEPSTLLAAHDKLLTARLLDGAGIPHPSTRLVTPASLEIAWDGPCVVKPRFGSWGREVVRCDSELALERHLASIAGAPWFRACGAVIQQLVEPRGFDVRLVVARGRIVGSVMRLCAEGEWRTNVALGAARIPCTPSSDAIRIAESAAAAVNGSLVGVDLLPVGADGWVVLEVNGAVEFTSDYALGGGDVFAATAAALVRDAEPVLAHAEA